MPIDDSKAGAGKEKTARAIVSPSVAAQIKAAAMTEGVAPEPGIATAGQLPPAGPKFATRPGVERWPVKTGTDADVAKVGKNVIHGKPLEEGIVPTTVEELIRIPRPADMMPPTSEFPAFEDGRKEPVETTIWQLKPTSSPSSRNRTEITIWSYRVRAVKR